MFSFNLAYHLENPLTSNSQTEIALPPDTAFQKVYINKIDPKPFNVRIDPDGNYLAIYKLKPRERIDVKSDGYVQIFSSFRSFPTPSNEVLEENLKPTNFWQSDNIHIKELANTLKTPEAIYDYVSTNLKYNLDRVQPNVIRKGAFAALSDPKDAICMEFTDLYIALARAAGIPAREINGYAYTENKDLQPLSLVADVLHSWPEYYDKNKKVWIPVDPTWGSTSGADFFNKLDLRHFAFVVHGTSDKDPYPPGSYKLGPNPQKDVYVSFGKLPVIRNSIPKITMKMARNIPFFETLYSVEIFNPGPASMYSFTPTIYFDDKLHSKNYIQILPPYSKYNLTVKTPYNILGKNTPSKIRAVAEESSLTLSTNKSQVVVNSLIMLFAIFIFIMIIILFKFKKFKPLKFKWIKK